MAADYSVPGLPMRSPSGETFTYDEAMRQLADALEALPTYVTPQTASALQATENLWRRVEVDGFLTGREVADLLELDSTDDAAVTALWRNNQLLGVRRRGQIRYPSFQFDREARGVKPVIPELLAIAAENYYSHADLLFWVFNRSTYFEGDGMPLEHLEPAEYLLDVARNSMGILW